MGKVKSYWAKLPKPIRFLLRFIRVTVAVPLTIVLFPLLLVLWVVGHIVVGLLEFYEES